MPRKNTAEQIPLIDVDDPKLKKIKKELEEYDSLIAANKEAASDNRLAEQQKRKNVFEAAKAAGVEPDADGVFHFRFGDRVWEVSQEAQLRIKKHKAPKESESDAEDDAAEN